MERSVEKPERKASRRSFKSKAATLPAGAVLLDQPGEGFFSKIRRSFKIRKKTNKFVLQHSLDDPQVSTRTDTSGVSSSADSLNGAEVKNRVKGKPKSSKTSLENDCAAADSVVLVSSRARPCSEEKITSQERLGDDSSRPPVQSEQEEGAAALAACSVTEDNNNDKYLDEFDPDYETLDNIRRQLHSRSNGGLNDLTDDSTKAETSKRLPDSQSHSTGSGKHNSSDTSANTGNAQANHSDSVTDLAAHESHLTGGSDLPGKSAKNSVPLVLEDDLYANAKVLMRKQQQKSNEMSTVPNTSQPKSVLLSSSSVSECKGVEQTENPDLASPPPLPARNYSEKDMAIPVEPSGLNEEQTSAISKRESDSHDDQPQLTAPTTNSSSHPDASNSDAVASKLFRRNSAFVEAGPVVVLSATQQICEGNVCNSDLSDKQLLLPCLERPHALTESTNSTLVPAAEKDDTEKSSLPKVAKTLEELEKELLFIDEDPVEDSNQQLIGPLKSHCPRDAGTKTTPNTFYTTSNDLKGKGEIDSACSGQTLMSPKNPVSHSVEGLQAVTSVGMSCQVKRRNCQEQAEPSCPAATANCGFDPDSKPPPRCKRSSASLSFLHSSSTPADLLPPPVPPKADKNDDSVHMRPESRRRSAGPTLTALRPQSAQLSRTVFPPKTSAAHLLDDDPPPLPPACRRNAAQGAGGRKAVSEELPLRRAKDSSLSREARRNYRHSSAVDASRAHNDFVKSMKQLKECGWYWGPLSTDEAVSKLTDKCDGSFLVRDSTSDRYLLTISFKFNGHVHHTRIEFHKGLFSFWEQPDEHSKAHICQFIEQTVEHSRKGNFIYFQRSSNSTANPLPIQLLYPVSRFYRVPSLQHMCRFQILCRVRRDHIGCLPLPQKVKDYLSEKQYYVEMLTED